MPPPFDTLTYMRQLETAGVPSAQASVHALALAEALQSAVIHPRDLQALERSMNDKFAAVDTKFAAVDARFESLERNINDRFAAVDVKFQSVDARFDAVNKRFDGLETKLTALTTQFREFTVSVRVEIKLLKWMAGTSLVLGLFAISTCVAIFSKLMQLIPH